MQDLSKMSDDKVLIMGETIQVSNTDSHRLLDLLECLCTEMEDACNSPDRNHAMSVTNKYLKIKKEILRRLALVPKWNFDKTSIPKDKPILIVYMTGTTGYHEYNLDYVDVASACWREGEYLQGAFYLSSCEDDYYDDYVKEQHVIAWMHLPTPPVADSDGGG